VLTNFAADKTKYMKTMDYKEDMFGEQYSGKLKEK
jgi:hypothetical protein